MPETEFNMDVKKMKIVQTWVRNTPSSTGGYSITIKYTYSSSNPAEIDEIEKKLPKGMLIIDTDEPDKRKNRCLD